MDDSKLRLLFYKYGDSFSLVHQGFGFTYSGSYTIGVYCAIALLLIIPEGIIRTVGRLRWIAASRWKVSVN